eukprot:4380703-Amphidinium_carterae.2
MRARRLAISDNLHINQHHGRSYAEVLAAMVARVLQDSLNSHANAVHIFLLPWKGCCETRCAPSLPPLRVHLDQVQLQRADAGSKSVSWQQHLESQCRCQK